MKKAFISRIPVHIALFLVASSFSACLSESTLSERYYDTIATGGRIEAKYTARGTYEVSSVVYKSGRSDFSEYKIWFPSVLKESSTRWPTVIFANGTGVPYSKYEAVFEHLASWGFIAVGNNDTASGAGISSDESLKLLLWLNDTGDSVFYEKVDVEHIGLSGHSQGGAGVINAATKFSHDSYYTALFSASCASPGIAESVLKTPYDASLITQPYFMVAGTGLFDAGDESGDNGISPLVWMKKNFTAITKSPRVVLARRKNADHGDMLTFADSYMTAWFMYYLKNDVDAGGAFFGTNMELAANENWQDVFTK